MSFTRFQVVRMAAAAGGGTLILLAGWIKARRANKSIDEVLASPIEVIMFVVAIGAEMFALLDFVYIRWLSPHIARWRRRRRAVAIATQAADEVAVQQFDDFLASMSRFFVAHEFVGDLVSSVLRIEDKALRLRFASDFKELSHVWSTVVSAPAGDTGPVARRLLACVMSSYFEHDRTSLSASPPRVLASLLCYASIVTRAVADAKQDGARVICFTTLPMLPTRWLNYDAISDVAEMPFTAVVEEWEQYTRSVRQLANDSGVELRRCLIATAGEIEPVGPYMDLALSDSETMARHCAYFVLVPKPGRHVDWKNVRPLERTEIRDILKRRFKSEETQRLAAELYDDVDAAYMIIPSRRTELPNIKGFSWEPVGELFRRVYHSAPESRNCRAYSFTRAEVDDWFVRAAPAERMPEDLFLIGIGNDDTPDEERWMFGVAANVGRDAERVTIEFMARGVSDESDRFRRVCAYADTVWTQARFLDDWLRAYS